MTGYIPEEFVGKCVYLQILTSDLHQEIYWFKNPNKSVNMTELPDGEIRRHTFK